MEAIFTHAGIFTEEMQKLSLLLSPPPPTAFLSLCLSGTHIHTPATAYTIRNQQPFASKEHTSVCLPALPYF